MVRFSDHAWEALDAHQARSTTIAQYQGIVKRWLCPALGTLPLGEITPMHVDRVLADVRAAGRSASWAQNVLICLRVIMQKAVLWGRIPDNPCDGAKVRTGRKSLNVLSPEQRNKLDAELARRGTLTNEAVLRVLLWTGLRLGEALALRHADFDPEARTLAVRTSKTDSGVRIVDVPDALVGEIERARNATPSLPIFFGRSERSLRRTLDAACARAGVPRLRVHDLRHTRVTTLLLAGVPVGYVSKQVGHASPAFTLKVYDHWANVATPEQRRAWANA